MTIKTKKVCHPISSQNTWQKEYGMPSKKKKEKKQKLPPLKKLQRQADKLWQDCIKLIHTKCISCGEPMKLGHHVFPKRLHSCLRYDLDNGVPACLRCHFKHHRFQDPILLYKALETRGFLWLVHLIEKSRDKLKKRDRSYFEGKIKELQEKYDALKENIHHDI